jgi:hypothetical protein
MLFSIKLDLSPQQLVSLKNAMGKGTDFKTRLADHQLMAGNFSIDVNKALYNKVIKHHSQGKGMIITLPSNILSKLKKTLDITEPSDLPIVSKRNVKVKGGAIAISTASVFTALGLVKEFIDDHPAVVQFLSNIAEDISYLLNNPMAISYRFIWTVKIPNLSKRYRAIIISIDRLKKIIPTLTNQTVIKRHQMRIINLETTRDRVGNHIQTLIERLPMIKKMAEERDETIKARQAAQIEKDLKKEMKEAEEAKIKFDALKKGNGLQVDPAPYYGNGIVVDKIKAKIKKNHLDPMIEKEKEKMEKKLEREIQKAKKKAETEVKKRLQTEIHKQIPFTGGCMHCGSKKKT